MTGVLSVSAQNDLGIARIADKKSVERYARRQETGLDLKGDAAQAHSFLGARRGQRNPRPAEPPTLPCPFPRRGRRQSIRWGPSAFETPVFHRRGVRGLSSARYGLQTCGFSHHAIGIGRKLIAVNSLIEKPRLYCPGCHPFRDLSGSGPPSVDNSC